MADYNTILRDDEIANLDPKKLDEATKKFQNVAYGITRDVTPVVGELQSYKYALEDAQAIAKAARGEEGYEDMTPIEALGYAGLTALGVAGTIPLVGPVFRSAQKGIRALMPKRGQRTLEPVQPPSAAQSQANLESFRRLIMEDEGFNYFVANLPEYRRTPEAFAENYREWMDIPETQRVAYREVATDPALRTDPLMKRHYLKADTHKQLAINEDNFNSKVLTNSSKALTIPTEPLTFAKGLKANQGDTSKSFLGSAAFDEVNRLPNEIATPQEWIGLLKGLRNKGVKTEELSDSGLVVFGKGNEVVGGDLFSLLKENPKLKITKGEILAGLESNPAYRLKTKDYNYPINTEEVLNVYPTFSKLSKDLDSAILRRTTEIEDIGQRTNLTQLSAALKNDRAVINELASKLSTNQNNLSYLKQTKNKLNQVLNQFKDNDKILIRTLMDEYDKAINIAERGVKATDAPRHRGTFPGGGFDYKEKVLYLDEPIPGNSNPKKVWSVHFNEPNAVTFVRYDTRGVDNYGDTYFMVELQSDPHQTLTKAGSTHFKDFRSGKTDIDPTVMTRRNPYSKNIRLRVKKREIQDTLDEIQQYNKIAMDRPLSPPEFDKLNELNKKLKVQESELRRAPVREGAGQPNDYSYGNTSMYDYSTRSYDYFPLGNESTWVKANIKGIINDARKNNKRYVALAPADFFQLNVNNKAKIEQFYGLGNRELTGDLLNPRADKKNFLNKDGSGMGKYRKWKKQEDINYPEEMVDAPSEELGGMAVVPKAMQDVAKEIGATFTTRKVYHTDPKKPYKIFDTEKNVPRYAFSKKYEMDEFYDNLSRTSSLEKIKFEADDPRNFVESIVIDLNGSSKGKMKGYKLGGLVEVDRSNFAPLF